LADAAAAEAIEQAAVECELRVMAGQVQAEGEERIDAEERRRAESLARARVWAHSERAVRQSDTSDFASSE
jgi:hypothetical protein